VVLCSHLLHDVEAVCRHVVVLSKGRIALSGSIDDVRRLESGVFRLRVYGDDLRLRAALAEDRVEVLEREGETYRLRAPEGAGVSVLCAAAARAECVVRELSTSHQSLTDVFERTVDAEAAA
jgi:ABC-2 type transport system ATP-binding protein